MGKRLGTALGLLVALSLCLPANWVSSPPLATVRAQTSPPACGNLPPPGENPKPILILIRGLDTQANDYGDHLWAWNFLTADLGSFYSHFLYFSYDRSSWDTYQKSDTYESLRSHHLPLLHDLLESCHQLGWQSFDIIGHSLGGVIASEYIKENGSNGSQAGWVRHVITLDSPINGSSTLAERNPFWPLQAFRSDAAIDLVAMYSFMRENLVYENVRMAQRLQENGIAFWTLTSSDDLAVPPEDAIIEGFQRTYSLGKNLTGDWSAKAGHNQIFQSDEARADINSILTSNEAPTFEEPCNAEFLEVQGACGPADIIEVLVSDEIVNDDGSVSARLHIKASRLVAYDLTFEQEGEITPALDSIAFLPLIPGNTYDIGTVTFQRGSSLIIHQDKWGYNAADNVQMLVYNLASLYLTWIDVGTRTEYSWDTVFELASVFPLGGILEALGTTEPAELGYIREIAGVSQLIADVEAGEKPLRLLSDIYSVVTDLPGLSRAVAVAATSFGHHVTAAEVDAKFKAVGLGTFGVVRAADVLTQWVAYPRHVETSVILSSNLQPSTMLTQCDFNIMPGDVTGLSAAVSSANASTKPNTVCLAPGTYRAEGDGLTTPDFLSISGDLMIRGDNDSLTALVFSDSRGDSLFYVAASGHLWLQNLSLSGTGASGAIENDGLLTLTNVDMSQWGFGLRNSGAATIEDALFINNDTFNGVISNMGTLSVTDSVFENNIGGLSAQSTWFGGAIDNQGTAHISNTRFTNNTGDKGGALASREGALTVEGSFFENNHADNGGAIWISGGSASISTSTFVRNQVMRRQPGGIGPFLGGEGGAIYNNDGHLTVIDTVFENNVGEVSSTLHNVNGMVTISGSCIHNNPGVSIFNDENAPMLQATGNWWGDANGPSGAAPGSGDMISTNVEYLPISTDVALDCEATSVDDTGDYLGRSTAITFNLAPENSGLIFSGNDARIIDGSYGAYPQFVNGNYLEAHYQIASGKIFIVIRYLDTGAVAMIAQYSEPEGVALLDVSSIAYDGGIIDPEVEICAVNTDDSGEMLGGLCSRIVLVWGKGCVPLAEGGSGCPRDFPDAELTYSPLTNISIPLIYDTTSIHVGMHARVTCTGGSNKFRQCPQTDCREIGRIPECGELDIIGGPIYSEGYEWWSVLYQGQAGWTAGGNGVTYWIEPDEQTPSLPDTVSCPGASNCSVTCANGERFEDACPTSGMFASCQDWQEEACRNRGGVAQPTESSQGQGDTLTNLSDIVPEAEFYPYLINLFDLGIEEIDADLAGIDVALALEAGARGDPINLIFLGDLDTTLAYLTLLDSGLVGGEFGGAGPNLTPLVFAEHDEIVRADAQQQVGSPLGWYGRLHVRLVGRRGSGPMYTLAAAHYDYQDQPECSRYEHVGADFDLARDVIADAFRQTLGFDVTYAYLGNTAPTNQCDGSHPHSNDGLIAIISTEAQPDLAPEEVNNSVSELPLTLYRPNTHDEALHYASLWSLTSFQDMQSPGTAAYTVAVDHKQSYRWTFTWCATSSDGLDEIAIPLTVNFFVNGRALDQTDLVSSRTDTCLIWDTVLSDWHLNEAIQLELRYSLAESVFDGGAWYSAGDYSHQITVSVE